MKSMPDINSGKTSLAVIGKEDTVAGFRAMGFAVYTVGEKSNLEQIFTAVIQQQAVVCLIEEEVYHLVEERISGYRSLPLPVFIPFGKGPGTDLLDGIVKGIRLRATGKF